VLIDRRGDRREDTGESRDSFAPAALVGLMSGYQNEHGGHGRRGEYYKTADVARASDAGAITFIGRADDVRRVPRQATTRLSPFELGKRADRNIPDDEDACRAPRPIQCAITIAKGYVAIAQACARIAEDAAAISSTMAGRSLS